MAEQIAEAISRRDLAALEAHSTEEMEYASHLTAADPKVYRGRAGWATYLADIDATWQELEMEVEDVMVVEPNTIVASVRITARARASGAKVDEKAYSVVRFRDGKAVRADTYLHQPEALRAAALPE